jgi:hypothetical protein
VVSGLPIDGIFPQFQGGLFTVSFPDSREVFQFKPTDIRPRLTFVNGKWVPVLGEAQVHNLKSFSVYMFDFFYLKIKDETIKKYVWYPTICKTLLHYGASMNGSGCRESRPVVPVAKCSQRFIFFFSYCQT